MLARAALDRLGETGEPVEFVDLQDLPLPLCDGAAAYAHPNALRLADLGRRADGVLLATPVYNYGVSAAAKNLVELTGRSWTGKTVGLLLAAGGPGSYMAGMGLANGLMLDFRCLIVPRFVYAEADAFDGDRVSDPDVDRRIAELAREVVRVSRALRAAT